MPLLALGPISPLLRLHGRGYVAARILSLQDWPNQLSVAEILFLGKFTGGYRVYSFLHYGATSDARIRTNTLPGEPGNFINEGVRFPLP